MPNEIKELKEMPNELSGNAKLDAKLMPSVLEFDPISGDDGVEVAETEAGFPFPLKSPIRILGVEIQRYMHLDAHPRDILSKAAVRQGILSRVAGPSRGLEVGVRSMTHDPIITSLLRYVLAFTDSCLPPAYVRGLTRAFLMSQREKYSAFRGQSA